MTVRTQGTAEAGDMLDAAPEMIADVFQFIGVEIKPFERAGQCADAAFNAGGHQLGQQIEEHIRVLQPLR